LATFVGVNFAQLGDYFGKAGGPTCWVNPGATQRGIHSRLLAHRDDPVTHDRFCKLYGPAQQHRLAEPVDRARLWQRHGRWELAHEEYRKALALQPFNWVLLNELANFLIFRLRGDDQDVYGGIKAGIDLAKLALAQNPTCSAELWCTLGDGLYEYGRYAEARSAYEQALRVNDHDVRARYNLAFVHIQQRDYAAALLVLAEALGLDRLGQYRDKMMAKFQEALQRQALQDQQEYMLLINLVSHFAPPVETGRPEPDRTGEGAA
jgi:tetratricopeptide (TPR) repeat protein